MASFLFVDSRVEGIDTLLAGLDEDIQVVLLAAGTDGIEQIVRTLSGVTGLNSIHMFSRVSTGRYLLGSTGRCIGRQTRRDGDA